MAIRLKYRPSLEHLERISERSSERPRQGPKSLAGALLATQLYGVPGLGRDPLAIATGLSAADLGLMADDLVRPVSSPNSAVRSALTEVEDGRLYSPVVDNSGASSRRRASRLVVPSPGRAAPAARPFTLAAVQYDLPQSVIVCIRRKARRGVLLAKGKGGGRHKKGRRRPNSNIWC